MVSPSFVTVLSEASPRNWQLGSRVIVIN
jgi:hypothetical protein